MKFESLNFFGGKVIPELQNQLLTLPPTFRKRQKMEASLPLHFLLIYGRKIEIPQIESKSHQYATITLIYSKTAITPLATKSCVHTENWGFRKYRRRGPRMQYFGPSPNLIWLLIESGSSTRFQISFKYMIEAYDKPLTFTG